MGADGMMHFIVSSVISTLLKVLVGVFPSIVITLTIGIAKEVYDRISKKGSAEWKDVVCDILGMLVGVL